MRNKEIIIKKTLIENTTDLNKKIITETFCYNQYVMENSNKDVDTKSSEDTNVQRTNKITEKWTIKT